MHDSDSSDESDDESDVESKEDYRRGGYHPVSLGDTFAGSRYKVLSKMGWGHFSTVWLAWDGRERRPVALKIQKSASRYADAAKDEVKLLKQARSAGLCRGRGPFAHACLSLSR